MSDLQEKVAQRRTFAIIAHPDAGKTTLTEKLLLFGGAIQMAGEVKAKGERRRARSDWLEVERKRGISVTSAVMTFERDGVVFNLLDTPGHEDFSEDTYRTLTAVDSAVMVLDAAKGIETQTRKLFEVCRLRDVPIITFINKMDREALDPTELLDDIEKTLALDVCPATWPIGMGRDFHGCYDLIRDQLLLFNREDNLRRNEPVQCKGLNDPQLDTLLPANLLAKLREDVDLVRGIYPAFDREAYLAGHLTPVFFGSAVNSFGVQELLSGLTELAPSPRTQHAQQRDVLPAENNVSGFVFKIQANMDPNHRDRVAFVRLCSGKLNRGMKLKQTRSGRVFALHNPVFFMAQNREIVDEAWAGDIIGIPGHGLLRIGDTITEGEMLNFTGIPSFAPEILRRVTAVDPMRTKHLKNALIQLSEEGVSQLFKPLSGGDWIVGMVGQLQLDVLQARIESEYNVQAKFEATSYVTARWIASDNANDLKEFLNANRMMAAEDHDDCPVFMARNSWDLQRTQQDWPKIRFTETREQFIARDAA